MVLREQVISTMAYLRVALNHLPDVQEVNSKAKEKLLPGGKVKSGSAKELGARFCCSKHV